MRTTLPQYSHDFPADKEVDVAGLLDSTATELFQNMQGPALETAIDAMQKIISRHYKGDSAVTIRDVLSAAREMRSLMHEKSALMRQCRAEAIERLGLRPRPAFDAQKSAEIPVAALAAEVAKAAPAPKMTPDKLDAMFETIVKKFEAASAAKQATKPTPGADSQSQDAKRSQVA